MSVLTDRVAAGGVNGVVATSNPLASQIGLEMLRRGGGAVDAAVAASFALGVVEPFMSGIGGGCFILLYTGGEISALDARGVAPAGADEDMFVRGGEVQCEAMTTGHRSVLVPGVVAGLAEIHRANGRLPLADLVEPGARTAEDGYAVSPMFARQVQATPHTVPALRRHPEATRIYLPGGDPPRAGARLANPDLAATYRLIGREGEDAFYRGRIAEAIGAEMRRGGGLITEADLAAYRPRHQKPLVGRYRNYTIHSLAPPSSGGILLVQCLNMLEGLSLPGRDRYAAETLHFLAEAMKLAYADRAYFVGDPRFVEVPVAGLTAKEYAAELRNRIDPGRASERLAHGEPAAYEGRAGFTTHLCVADREGTIVAITQTIGSAMGSGVVVPGTGILLNHLMGDFSANVGAPNVQGWGAYTSTANAVAPGKTPTSSNAPVIVMSGGRPVLATGAAGGSRIPSAVLQIVLNALDFGMDIQTAIAAARIHDQGEGLEIEKEVPEDTRRALAEMGHTIVRPSGYRDAMPSYAQGIAVDQARGLLWGGADPRDDGLALAY